MSGEPLVVRASELAGADIATVDALCRQALAARRLGRTVRVDGAPEPLREFLSFLGLAEAVPCTAELCGEPGRKPEERE